MLEEVQSTDKLRSTMVNLRLARIFFFLFATLYAEEQSVFVGNLPNGLTYYIHRVPSLHRYITIDYIVRAGSAYERDGEKGFAHLTEHLVGRSLKFKGVEVQNEYCLIWRPTANHSAFSSYEYTQFHFEIPPPDLAAGLLMLSDIPQSIKIMPDTLQAEKKEIFEEIYEEDPSQKFERERLSSEYSPYQDKHLIGDVQDISGATVDQIMDFHRTWYQPQRAAVVVIGNVDLEETQQLIQKLFVDIPLGSCVDFIPQLETSDVFIFGYQSPLLKMPQLSLSYFLPKMTAEEQFVFSMGIRYFLKSLQQATQETSLSDPSIETISFPSILRLTFTLPDTNYEKSLNELKSIFKKLDFSAITQQQLDQLKAEINESLAQQPPEFLYESLITTYRTYFLQGGSAFDRILIEDFLRAITLDKFQQGMQLFESFLMKTQLEDSLGSL